MSTRVIKKTGWSLLVWYNTNKKGIGKLYLHGALLVLLAVMTCSISVFTSYIHSCKKVPITVLARLFIEVLHNRFSRWCLKSIFSSNIPAMKTYVEWILWRVMIFSRSTILYPHKQMHYPTFLPKDLYSIVDKYHVGCSWWRKERTNLSKHFQILDLKIIVFPQKYFYRNI